MNNKITFPPIIDALEKNNQPFALLPLQNGISLIITQYGARILGPFLSNTAESIFWVNQALARPDSFKEFLNSGDWNLGGERVWIAPEVQYLVRDRSDFWGSIHIPPQMDPGQYTLTQSGPSEWRLSQSLTLPAYNLATGDKELRVERFIHPAENPLRYLNHYSVLMNRLTFAGYEQVVVLSETQPDDKVSETWNLIQLNPGGQLLIPASPHLEYSDYYQPIDSLYQSIHPNYVSLNISGDRMYKVGYKAAHVFGRLAYFNQLDDEQAYLLVRNFFNNPALPYAEEPSGWPGRCGHSIHVYNDDGGLGGFGELECNGQTIGGSTGRSTNTDQFVLWLYVGPVSQVKQLIPHLLGIEI
jgi:hypothetical protein